MLRALDALFKQPLATANSLARDLDVAFVTANNTVLKLCELGLLDEETGYKRNRRFRFTPYLQLFEEQESTQGVPGAPSEKSRR